MRRLLAVACAGLLALAAAADARVVVFGKRCPPRDTGAGWPAELAALRARPNAEASEDARTLAIALPAQSEAWYYTKAGHPAHPAKAHKIISVIENRAVKVHVEGTFNGSKRAFYTWLKGLSQDDRLGVAPRP
ncbi:MAG: hypothetical protein HY749_13160 [Gammaproteobacteria bacterium]|nr:hypothetical protein [Gammaproteobacteria bacterium]MBI5616031.1 hypothetical protein [Gammaproteobacteria bacterium]